MATQSLAMGEAFGKSFQYGKRKISSMSNDEFNRYTFADMMNEQTANIRMLVPKLHEQMQESGTMQKDIFKEMINIIPKFMEAILESLSATGGHDHEGEHLPFLPSDQHIIAPEVTMAADNTQQQSTIVNISHAGADTTTDGDTGGGTTVDPAQQRRINLRNRIKNWNKHTTEGFITSLEYKDFPTDLQKIVDDHLADLIRFENQGDDKPPEQTPLTSTEKAQKEYLSKTVELQVIILEWVKKVNVTGANIVNSGPIQHLVDLQKRNHKKLAAARTVLRNFVSLSRNNLVLKSVANRDWNDRIWSFIK